MWLKCYLACKVAGFDDIYSVSLNIKLRSSGGKILAAYELPEDGVDLYLHRFCRDHYDRAAGSADFDFGIFCHNFSILCVDLVLLPFCRGGICRRRYSCGAYNQRQSLFQ